MSGSDSPTSAIVMHGATVLERVLLAIINAHTADKDAHTGLKVCDPPCLRIGNSRGARCCGLHHGCRSGGDRQRPLRDVPPAMPGL